MTDENTQTFAVRCTNCPITQKIGPEDCDEEDTPASKAARMQKSTTDTCPNCGEVRFGVSVETAEN